MTLEELNRGLKLEKQITEQEEILEALRAKAYPGAQRLDGMPHVGGISDKTSYLGVAIAELETNIEGLRLEQRKALKETEEFIQGVGDQQTKTIMRLRFQSFLLWKEVADMMGPYYNDRSIRTAVYNWLKKYSASCCSQ